MKELFEVLGLNYKMLTDIFLKGDCLWYLKCVRLCYTFLLTCCSLIWSNSQFVTAQKKPVTTMLTYPWKCTVLHCNHLGNTWKPLVLMTRHIGYCPNASEGDNQMLAWWLARWLLAFVHSVWFLYSLGSMVSKSWQWNVLGYIWLWMRDYKLNIPAVFILYLCCPKMWIALYNITCPINFIIALQYCFVRIALLLSK